MTDPMDGGYDSEGRYYDPDEAPGNTVIGIECTHFRREITDVVAKSISYIESDKSVTALRLLWPILNEKIGAVLRRIHSEDFSKVLDQLLGDFTEEKQAALRDLFAQLGAVTERISPIIDVRELSRYPSFPDEKEKREQIVTLLDDFTEEFIKTYNKIALLKPQRSLWFDPERGLTTVKTGNYL